MTNVKRKLGYGLLLLVALWLLANVVHYGFMMRRMSEQHRVITHFNELGYTIAFSGSPELGVTRRHIITPDGEWINIHDSSLTGDLLGFALFMFYPYQPSISTLY